MAAITKLPLAHQTMFADLIQRTMDAAFDASFRESGSFVQVTVKDRQYWYYAAATTRTGDLKPKRARIYVGPVDDPEVAARVVRFSEIKDDYRERQQMVRSLVAAGLPTPTGLAGDVTAALAKAGLLRLRGVMVGTVAFQAYSGFLGVRMPGAALMTGDADFAQFHSISVAVEDALPPIMDVLRELDQSFKPVPHMSGSRQSMRFRNRTGFDVEFLTSNTGSDDHQGRPATMPALGGASAEPLRYLDFLIHEPVRSCLLHRGGVDVFIPAPERYAVHKLIVSTLRQNNGRLKAQKDVMQASLLIQALALERRAEDVGRAWMEAWRRGPGWQSALTKGRTGLDAPAEATLSRALAQACELDGVHEPSVTLPSP